MVILRCTRELLARITRTAAEPAATEFPGFELRLETLWP
jgi:hypothetical protein